MTRETRELNEAELDMVTGGSAARLMASTFAGAMAQANLFASVAAQQQKERQSRQDQLRQAQKLFDTAD